MEMTMETIKVIVENSNTMEELEQAEKMLKDKRRWLRKLHFTLPSSISDLIPDGDLGPESLEKTLFKLTQASEEVKVSVQKEISTRKDIDAMLVEVSGMLDSVTHKMKDLIWNKK